MKEVISFLSSENAVIRYWGVLGCLILEKEALPAKNDLIKLLKDTNADVRITAAEALYKLGEVSIAKPIIIEALKDESNEKVRLHAMNSITNIGGQLAQTTLPIIEKIIEKRENKDYLKKIGNYLIETYKPQFDVRN